MVYCRRYCTCATKIMRRLLKHFYFLALIHKRNTMERPGMLLTPVHFKMSLFQFVVMIFSIVPPCEVRNNLLHKQADEPAGDCFAKLRKAYNDATICTTPHNSGAELNAWKRYIFEIQMTTKEIIIATLKEYEPRLPGLGVRRSIHFCNYFYST